VLGALCWGHCAGAGAIIGGGVKASINGSLA